MTRRIFVALGLASCVAVLLVGPLVPWGTLRSWRAHGVALDVVVGLALLWVLQAVAGGFRRPPRWTGSWRAWMLGAGWSLLVTFELGRLASRSATSNRLRVPRQTPRGVSDFGRSKKATGRYPASTLSPSIRLKSLHRRRIPTPRVMTTHEPLPNLRPSTSFPKSTAIRTRRG